jgi:hypothetical protein
VQLYKKYVRPHLEFSSPAWSPWQQGDIDCLEKVQERAVQAVSGLQARDYHSRLQEIGLPTLADRRKEADMVQTYKIIGEKDSEMCNQLFEKTDGRRATRQNNGLNNLVTKRAGHNFRRKFFNTRVTEPWNKLPDHIKEAKTAYEFKKRFRLHVGRGVVQRDSQDDRQQR